MRSFALVALLFLVFLQIPLASAQKDDPVSMNTLSGRYIHRLYGVKEKDYLKVEIPTIESVQGFNGKAKKKKFDLSKEENVEKLKAEIAKLNQLSDIQQQNPPAPDVFTVDEDAQTALKLVLELLNLFPREAMIEREEVQTQIAEILSAFRHSYESPLKPVTFPLIPWKSFFSPIFSLFSNIVKYFANPLFTTGKPAQDPLNSSFWQSTQIEDLELYRGFGRDEMPDYSGTVCEYKEAKKGYGTHPGFSMTCGEDKVKVKVRFGNERYSNPFNTRIFWALGYNVDPVDRLLRPRMRYDKRLFTEFNSRKPVNLEFMVGVPFTKIKKRFAKFGGQGHYSAFDFVQQAVVNIGEGEVALLTGEELRQKLLINPAGSEFDEANYNEEYGNKIQELVLEPAVIKYKVPNEYAEVGPWSFDSLDHPFRKEVRSLYVLAAWLNNFDLRLDNTRLRIMQTPTGLEPMHYLSDVGSGLGKAPNAMTTESSEIGMIPWDLITKEERGEMDIYIFKNFASAEMNKAFGKMAVGDAQWMLRRMSRFSQSQILQALGATKMSAAEARLALEKLISRRNNLITVLGLAQELAQAILPVDRVLNYDPTKDVTYNADTQTVQLSVGGSSPVTFSVGNLKVVNGRLVAL